jgi:uncharacterized repeat protein (TIGR04076 family)
MLDDKDPIQAFIHRVNYGVEEIKQFREGGHRPRHVRRLAEAAPKYSIEARVVEARHCNSGYRKGDRFILDMDGNCIARLCPKKLCVYLVSQLVIPVALINERLSEGLEPGDFHFMRYVRCQDAGVARMGYGEVTLKVNVIPRTMEKAA